MSPSCRGCGQIGKALDYESKDCRFEPCLPQLFAHGFFGLPRGRSMDISARPILDQEQTNVGPESDLCQTGVLDGVWQGSVGDGTDLFIGYPFGCPPLYNGTFWMAENVINRVSCAKFSQGASSKALQFI